MNKKSSFLRIDEQVFFTMGGVLILSIIILAFRFTLRTECTTIKIVVGNGPHLTGVPIAVKAEVKEATSYSWDFGDGTIQELGGAMVNHSYKKSGKYTISVLVNGKCNELYDIFISELPPVLTPPTKISFIGPDLAYVNQEVKFTDTSLKHTKWEWYAEGSPGAIGYGNSVSYKFTSEGVKEVSVKVNGEDVLKRSIIITIDPKKLEEENQARLRRQERDPRIVVPKEKSTEPPITVPGLNESDESKKSEPPPVEKPKLPEISAKQMGDYIVEYNKDKINGEFFAKYFCGSVSVEYENKFMPFAEFLKKVKDIRKIKSISVKLVQDETNCVKEMSVKIVEKKIWGNKI